MKWPKEEIVAEIEKCIQLENVFLVDWKFTQQKSRYQLKVKLESDSGISMKELAEVNRRINREFALPDLDIEMVSVEVTSPGVNTSIKSLRHFRRYLGHVLVVKYKKDDETVSIEGELSDVSPESITLSLKNESVEIPLTQIIEGRVVLKW